MMSILFIVCASFPYGSATSSRALNIVKLLVDVGCKVHVIADSLSTPECDIRNCSFIGLEKNSKPIGELSFEKAREYCNNNKVDIILMNAKNDRYNLFADYCKNNNIKLIIENCEWYDSSNYRWGKRDTEFLLNEKMLNEDFIKADGFISISRLLHSHNSKLNKFSVRIPTILDTYNIVTRTRIVSDKISLIYTGRPGRSKELLMPIMKALISNPKFYKNITFHIYGPDLLHILYNINFNIFLLIRSLKCIVAHGNITQEKIFDKIKEADYQIFLRPNRRSSNAGFPTKLAESMSVGTPVISNDTGDISLYINNGVNGFLLKDNSVDSVVDVLNKIMSINLKEREKIRQNARMTAEQYFDYKKYKEPIKNFLLNIMRGKNE